MTLSGIKSNLLRTDEKFFCGRLKKFYSYHFVFRNKTYRLKKEFYFPPHSTANKNIRFGVEHNGELLAIGGDLSPERMILAYKNGIAPIYFENEIIKWWTSENRCIIPYNGIHISRTMRAKIRKNNYHLTVDKAFKSVITACTEMRESNTWITNERIQSACEMHEMGIAHSVEVWQEEHLVGGLFGVSFGTYFQIESLFTRVNHMSKIAMIALVLRLEELNYKVIDCGFSVSDHIKSMGGKFISRDEFLKMLEASMNMPEVIQNWDELFKYWDFNNAVNNQYTREREL